MPTLSSVARAGRWFLNSGIQEPSGGVARYYRSEIGRNKPVSTEITGYAVSAFVYLYRVTGEGVYLDRATRAARFLLNCAWNPGLKIFPFEHPSPSAESPHRAWFFDCGIIVRGLVALWRETRDDRLLDRAYAAGEAMLTDFASGEGFHPVLELPEKRPVERSRHWSLSPGCYQLKAAMAWLDLADLTGDDRMRAAYEGMLGAALIGAPGYLPDHLERHRIMDRLHPMCYFLEALTPVLNRRECQNAYREGLAAVSNHLREITPSFVRSDVYAQLLRARIYGAEIAPVDGPAAGEEAGALLEFQASSEDRRIDGGFLFGRRNGELSPHVNPVSAAFALQALEMWRGHQTGNPPPCRHLLI